jgi:hypothetical protein
MNNLQPQRSSILLWLVALFGLGAGAVYLVTKSEKTRHWAARELREAPWWAMVPLAPLAPLVAPELIADKIRKIGFADVLRQVQAKLGIPTTGENDTATRAAVTAYQRAHGLHVDGAIGPETLRSLGITPANEREVAQTSTPMAPTDIARTFAAIDPSLSTNSLALILAQFAFETGEFKKGLHNYNYGNYTHILGDGQNYYVGGDTDAQGRPVTHKFVAFTSPQDGAHFWVTRMRTNRPQVWAKIMDGTDPQGFVHALKQSRYFEGPEAPYVAGVVGYYNKYKRMLEGVA